MPSLRAPLAGLLALSLHLQSAQSFLAPHARVSRPRVSLLQAQLDPTDKTATDGSTLRNNGRNDTQVFENGVTTAVVDPPTIQDEVQATSTSMVDTPTKFTSAQVAADSTEKSTVDATALPASTEQDQDLLSSLISKFLPDETTAGKVLVQDPQGLRFFETSGARLVKNKTPIFTPQKVRPGFPISTIWERTFDTVEDALLHARRIPYDKGWIEEPPRTDERPVLLILGSGWGAHAMLKVADTRKYRILVVSPSNHFVFTPSK
jgi:hypothetical protein